MTCAQCRSEIPANAPFCQNCGRSVSLPSPATSQVPAQPKKANCFQIGCLSLLGLFIFSIVMATLVARNAPATPPDVSHNGSHPHQTQVAQTPNACDQSNKFENQSADALGNDQYQKAYDLAQKGLAIVDDCQNDDAVIVNKGYLLSMKG